MGQRTNFGNVGRNTPARPEGSGAQCPSHGDWDLHILHPTTRIPPLHPGAPRGAVRQRDLPARPGCAGSSRPCSAQRGPRGARGAAAQPPAPRPRSSQRRQPARASRTSSASRIARTAPADPARPQSAPLASARHSLCPALLSRLHCCRLSGGGDAGERPREGRGGPAAGSPAQQVLGWVRESAGTLEKWVCAAVPWSVRAGRPTQPQHTDTLSAFFFFFCTFPPKSALLLNRIHADSNSLV